MIIKEILDELFMMYDFEFWNDENAEFAFKRKEQVILSNTVPINNNTIMCKAKRLFSTSTKESDLTLNIEKNMSKL